MVTSKKTPSERQCKKGHRYLKSSDCPTCPTCEKERLAKHGAFSILAAPAQRALEHHGIVQAKDLCAYSEKELLQWHGIGPSSIPKLKHILQEAGLQLKQE